MASESSLPSSPTFPMLTPENHQITSPPTPRYNCIAHAAGDMERWWWPDEDEVAFWPIGSVRQETIEAFVAAFRTLGYVSGNDARLEPGYEKIAVYVSAGKPTHAARQLPDGRWSSKLGRAEDLAHELVALDGPLYGQAAIFLQRRQADEAATPESPRILTDDSLPVDSA